MQIRHSHLLARSLSLLAVLCLMMLHPHAAVAQDPLAKTATFTPTVSFSESHTDKVVTIVDNSDPEFPFVSRELVTSESVSLTVIGNITGIDLSSINETTPYSLTMGNLTLSGTLGDDILYTPGKTSIFIPALGYNDNDKPIGTHGLRLSWTATRLTATFVGSTATDMPGSVELDNWTSISETVPSVRAISSISLEFANFIAPERPIYVTGKATFSTKNFGTEESGIDSFDLINVSLSGSCEFGLPVTTLLSPKSGSEAAAPVAITGKSTDGHGIAEVEFALNPNGSDPEWIDVTTLNNPELTNPDLLWGSSSATWSITVNSLIPGTNFLWVRTKDISGNYSATLIVALVNPLAATFLKRWDGLLEPTATNPVRGAVTYTFSANGFYTGKLFLETGIRSISGYLNSDGKVSNVIQRPGLPDLTLSADLLDSNGLTLLGRIRDAGDHGATFTAYPSPYTAAAPPNANLQGRFHIGIAAPVAPTLGQSYLIATSLKTGVVNVTGRMADSTVVTWSGVLGSTGQIPLFAPLYSTMYLTKGSVSSLLRIDGASRTIQATTLRWVRPLGATDKQFPVGYDVVLATSGVAYTPPAAATRVMNLPAGTANAQAVISGDAVAGTLTKTFTVNANNTTTQVLPNPNSLTIAKIPAATGLGTGTFKLPGTTTSAAINYLIVGNQAFGHYVAPALAGTVNKRFGTVTLSASAPLQ